MAFHEPVSFQDISADRWIDPDHGQIWVHYHPGERPLSRIVEMVESFGGDAAKVQVYRSTFDGMKIARFHLTNQDVSHIVIGLIENLGLEARGCGPAVQPETQA